MTRVPIIYIFDRDHRSDCYPDALSDYFEDNMGNEKPLTLNSQGVFDTLIKDCFYDEHLMKNITRDFDADDIIISCREDEDDRSALTVEYLARYLEKALGLPITVADVSEITAKDDKVNYLLTGKLPHVVFFSISEEQVNRLMEQGQEAHHLIELISDFLTEEHDIMMTIDQALLEAGFLLEESDNATFYYYHHPETQATCWIKTKQASDLLRLMVKSIQIANDARLRLDISTFRGANLIENLVVSEASQLRINASRTITYLNLDNSTLRGLMVMRPLYALKMVDSSCLNSTINPFDGTLGYGITIKNSTLNGVYLEENVGLIRDCHINGLTALERTQLIRLTNPVSEVRADLRQVTKVSSVGPIYALPTIPVYGKTIDLNGQSLDYTLVLDLQGQRYLHLGPWLVTLDEALELIQGEHVAWPSFDESCNYSQLEIQATRKRYTHLVRMLRPTPVR